MNKHTYHLFLCIAFGLLLIGCQTHQEKKLTIACAANMQFAIQEITQIFEQKTHIKTDIIINSSGKLTAQILSGAPFDVFLSANTTYPNTLKQKGFLIENPKTYAKGQLVLWTNTSNSNPTLNTLNNQNIQHIALANPKTAPYGLAAKQVMEQLPFYDKIASKLIFGESILQTNQFIVSKTAQIGFSSLSIVQSPKLKNTGRFMLISSKLHSPIEQSLAITKHAKHDLQKAIRFKKFLFSKKGKEILNKYGYLVD